MTLSNYFRVHKNSTEKKDMDIMPCLCRCSPSCTFADKKVTSSGIKKVLPLSMYTVNFSDLMYKLHPSTLLKKNDYDSVSKHKDGNRITIRINNLCRQVTTISDASTLQKNACHCPPKCSINSLLPKG